jgi:general secretion pathway protein G
LATSRKLSAPTSPRPQRAYTLAELLVALCALAILAAIAVPSYTAYVQRANIAVAIGDIKTIELAIGRYRISNNDALPPNLASIGTTRTDPWGRSYVYLPFTGLKGKGAMRKDKNLVPLNSEYDLYSLGKDGDSRAPLNAKASRDDIILANDGAYVGLASDY